MKLERRSSFGWPATAAGSAPCASGLVVHYDGSRLGLAAKPHSACQAYWRNTRRFHMGPDRRWADIGYSFGVCPHGVVFEGRGFGRQQAAQPGGNSTWTSCTFMSGDGEKPTVEQVNAFKELRAWLRGRGLAAAIRGHRDFISTSCPGGILYDMVKSGALAGALKEEDMPLTEADVKMIWGADGIIEAPDGVKENPFWAPKSHIADINKRLRGVETALAQVLALLKEKR